MNKLIVIAQREFMAMVGTKAFLVTLIMMPVLMFGGIFLMPLLSKMGGTTERTIHVVDGSGQLSSVLIEAAAQRQAALATQTAASNESTPASSGNPMATSDPYRIDIDPKPELTDEERLNWSDEIRSGRVYALVEVPTDFITAAPESTPKIRFVSNDAGLSEARMWMSSVVEMWLRNRRYEELGLDAALVTRAHLPIVVEPAALYERQSTQSGSGVEAKVAEFDFTKFFIPFGLMMLMFLVIFLAAQPMLESAMEEKSQRIAEVLLGSVSPFVLMSGKMLGNVAASLMVCFAYGIGAVYMLIQRDMLSSVPLSIVPWFIVFQILGVLFYSSIFIAVGSSVRDVKEAQSLLLPVWMMLVIPMMVWIAILRDPLGPAAVAMSFFPPATPMICTLRIGTGVTIPLWQLLLATVELAAATIGVLYMAGKLYRVGLLRGDSVKSYRQIFGRLFRA
jgi:ABC-2 type transport system permease protein